MPLQSMEDGRRGANAGNKASQELLTLLWRILLWAQMGTITEVFKKWGCIHYQEALALLRMSQIVFSLLCFRK